MIVVMAYRLVLVVDDDAGIRRYVSTILHGIGFRTVEAESGTEGFRVVQDVNGRLDLIVSDIVMPNGDGISLASSVAASYPAIPLLLVSGYVKQKLQDMNGAVVEFLPKPFLPDKLIGAVTKLTGTNEQDQPQSRN